MLLAIFVRTRCRGRGKMNIHAGEDIINNNPTEISSKDAYEKSYNKITSKSHHPML